MSNQSSDGLQIRSAKKLFAHIGEKINSPISIRLWDGSFVPLGENASTDLYFSLSGPGVIGALLRKPTPDNLLRHYAKGHIDFHGADLFTFLETARVRNSRRKAKRVKKSLIAMSLLPFIFAKAEDVDVDHCFAGDETGLKRQEGDNKDFIQFHYDVSNDFYKLFLDQEMVYSCAYFTDWNNSLEQAQFDKLDMICRKLQLKPGDRYLDIGCGWGALVCHAAANFGVHAHGITLSEEQLAHAKQKIKALGLEDRVTVELRDYNDLSGTWDKVSSIGMVEHVGIDNMQGYMQMVSRILSDRGMFLNHGITRPAKRTARKFRKMTPERRLLAKYIFPGGELDHLGHMTQTMEAAGFEVHDVEGWRDHYALTCKLWCQRLSERKEEAIKFVGLERYRMWLLYLAGVSFALGDGSACIFQTVATKHASKGHSGMPPTREHLYEKDTPMVRNLRAA